MSGDRCPRCGGLVAADAEWCGQCFAPLRGGPDPGGAPETATLPAPAGRAVGRLSRRVPEPRPGERPSIRKIDDRLIWDCPACDLENPIENAACTRCGTSFGALFQEEGAGRRTLEPGRALGLSLLFPGVGHMALGRAAEGLARAVIFLWSLASLLVIVFARSGRSLGPVVGLVAVYVAVSGGLYVLTAVDARRAAVGEDPVIGSRALLYGSSGLMLLTVVILVFTGLGANR